MLPSFLQPETVPYASIEIVRVNGHIDHQPLVVVCSWHTSGAELLTLSRQFPGQVVSHAICDACLAAFDDGAA